MLAVGLAAEKKHAFEPPAIERAIVVDRATIVVTEEPAPAVHVGEDALFNGSRLGLQGNARRKRCEATALVVPDKQDGVFMSVLLAAECRAGMARAGTDDRDAKCHNPARAFVW